MYSVSELMPNNSRKSFYGKAHVIHANGTVYLRSYDTIVASVTGDGVLHRHWGGWSSTTGRHISSFSYGFAGREIRKKEWDALPVEKYPLGIY